MRLRDKVAVVTGAGRGIGRSIAVAFGNEGARVVLAARSERELRETAAHVAATSADYLIAPTDVTQQGQVEALMQVAVAEFSRIDVLVNNAGISGPMGPLETNDVAEWIETINVNLTGTFLCCRAAIPIMLGNGGGRIINLSGAGATNAWSHMSAYCSSKVAVVRLTEVLAQELEGRGVTVNALGPGSVHTTMWDRMTEQAEQVGASFIHETGLRVTSGGGASIDDCAELAVFLASDESGALSGRLISAATDDFRGLPPRISEIMDSDAYTLRRMPLP